MGADITEAKNQADSAGITVQQNTHLIGSDEGHNSEGESEHPCIQDTNCNAN